MTHYSIISQIPANFSMLSYSRFMNVSSGSIISVSLLRNHLASHAKRRAMTKTGNASQLLVLMIEKEPYSLPIVHPEMVGFGSERGLNGFEAAGITCYYEDFKKAKTKLPAKRCRFWMDTR